MTDYPTTGSATVEVAVSAAAAWALVGDVTRIGEFSPECKRVEWTSGSELAVGNMFRGFNERPDYQWDVECELTEVTDGASFTYVVPPGFAHATSWSFAVEETDSGARITQSFHAPMLALPEVYPGKIEGRCAELQAAIETTTSAIKDALESQR